MTENERVLRDIIIDGNGFDYDESIPQSIFEEIQQYRAIGTIEECRVAVDRMKPKKAIKDEYDRLTCPNCKWIVYQDEYGGRSLPCCENCGQTIDWSE